MALLNHKPIEELMSFDSNSSYQMVFDIIQVYFDLAPEMLRKVESAVHTRDVESLRLVVHSLKSSSRALGCEDLGNLCYDIEVLAKKGVFPASELIDNLKLVFAQSLEELKQLCKEFSIKKSSD